MQAAFLRSQATATKANPRRLQLFPLVQMSYLKMKPTWVETTALNSFGYNGTSLYQRTYIKVIRMNGISGIKYFNPITKTAQSFLFAICILVCRSFEKFTLLSNFSLYLLLFN